MRATWRAEINRRLAPHEQQGSKSEGRCAGGRGARATRDAREKNDRRQGRARLAEVQPDADDRENKAGNSNGEPVADLAILAPDGVAFFMAVQRRGGAGGHEEDTKGEQDFEEAMVHAGLPVFTMGSAHRF